MNRPRKSLDLNAMRPRSNSRRGWHHRTLTVLISAGLLTSLVPGMAPQAAAAPRRQPPPAQVTAPVPERPIDVQPRLTEAAAQDAFPGEAVTWPAPGGADVPVASAETDDAVVVGGLEVALAGPEVPLEAGQSATDARLPDQATVQVEVLSQQASQRAGLAGPILQLSGAGSGAVTRLDLSYEQFADAIGGDWASRVRLVKLPECALLTPSAPACAPMPLESTNNLSTRQVGADLPDVSARQPTGDQQTAAPTSPLFVAMSAGPSGSAGSFAATPMSPSSSWVGGSGTGDFNWSYPMRVPPSVGGPAPELGISYSSASVDGRTASTNNQPSWIGEGHDLSTPYIERRYLGCSQDMTGGASNTVKTGDLCWTSDNATLSMGGRSGELVRNAADGTWRLKNDDGSRMERLTGGTNGDNDGEYWRLTTTDGTQYYFGMGKRTASDTENTNATWTVPVFGNHVNEPCRAGTFAASSCQQAWRWNLDYVIDPHQNTMTNYYVAETNNYGRNLNSAISTYTRGGYLTRVDYSQRQGSEYASTPPTRVTFTTAERCLPSGAITCDPPQLTLANASHWPDVPFDQICTSTTSCPNQLGPSFFSRKRLVGVTTQYWTGSTYQAVDAWTLRHEFKDPGDGTSKSLWLAGISHEGRVGTTITLPEVTFVGTQLSNRVDGLDNAPPLIKWRVSGINTDTGGSIAVNYSGPDCTPTSLPTSPQANGRRCYPAYFTPEGASSPTVHHFHKYVVMSVVEGDRFTAGLAVSTAYDYQGAPAWAYDEGAGIPAQYRTYGQWRGYGIVDVRTGTSPAPQTLERTLFMRGMDDDPLPGGARRQTTVTDSQGGVIEDHPRLAGFIRERVTYNGAAGGAVAGNVVSGEINDPWVSAATATPAVSGPTATAHYTDILNVRSRTPLSAGGVRNTETRNTYDSRGRLTQTDDLGDTSIATDDRCTRSSYLSNTTAWILDYASRVETVGKACAATTSRPTDVISDQRMIYDGASVGVAPTRGLVTRTQEADSYNAGAPVYVTTSTTAYDGVGRPTTVADALNRTTTTSYTPSTGGPLTGTTVTNPATHATITTVHPAWGSAVVTVDANNRRTEQTYDSLGRLTAAWGSDRNKAAGDSASTTFTYQTPANGPVSVSTNVLRNDGSYTTSWVVFDGLGRQRQSQSPAAGAEGGRMISETTYDTHGWVVDQNGPFYATGAPSNAMFGSADNQIPAQNKTVYDGAGRPTAQIFRTNQVERWRTTTVYGGDRVTATPPAGAPPTTKLVDARGQTTELRSFLGATPTGTYEATRYTYTSGGNLKSVIDAAGNTWSYGYDLRGRQTSADDPDRGLTTSTYDAAGQLTTTTDARGTVLARTYDALGRQITLRDNSISGTIRSSWLYDTLAKGQLTSSTRHVGTATYVQAITGYDNAGRPTGTATTIPAAEGALAGTYTTNTTYNIDGGIDTTTLPVAPGVPNETLTYSYDATGLPTSVLGSGAYVADTIYSPYGQPLRYTMGQFFGKSVWQSFSYDVGTRRPTNLQLDRETVAQADSSVTWEYDAAGNVTAANDPRATGGDYQCFTYDSQRRLSQAWTRPSTATCAQAPQQNTLAGVAPYWHTFTYDTAGNRISAIKRTPSSTQTSTYTHPASGSTSTRPHAVSGASTVSTGSGPGITPGTVARSYQYDDLGNTSSIQQGSEATTLSWDAEARLSSITKPGVNSSIIYDANGNRLVRRDAGSATLFLGSTEIRLTISSGAKASTRYYSFGSSIVASRTSAGVQFLTPDLRGTAQHAVHASTMAITSRRTSPFGESRTSTVTWPNDQGFVGGTEDPSGFTQLGARSYDPQTGRFLSVDQVIDYFDAQQINGYAYASNNPSTFSDPDGLLVRQGYDGLDAQTITQKFGITDKTRMGLNFAPRTTRRAAAAPSGGLLSRPSPFGPNSFRGGLARGILEVGQAGSLPLFAFDRFIAPRIGLGNIEEWYSGGDCGWEQRRCLAGRAVPVVASEVGITIATGGVSAVRRVPSVIAAVRSLSASRAASTAARTCSFAATTTVVMANGEHLPISEVRPGQKVLAADAETGESGPRVVDDVFSHEDDLVNLRLSNGESLMTTGDHPFWSMRSGAFVRADVLIDGDTLMTDSGALVSVASAVQPSGRGIAFNLSVRDLHTFHVGSTAVLVHNTCPIDPRAVHGASQAGLRNIDVDEVWSQGDLFIQEADGQVVRVLQRGDGTYDAVVRDPSSGGTTTTFNLTENSLQQRIDTGRWS